VRPDSAAGGSGTRTISVSVLVRSSKVCLLLHRYGSTTWHRSEWAQWAAWPSCPGPKATRCSTSRTGCPRCPGLQPPPCSPTSHVQTPYVPGTYAQHDPQHLGRARVRARGLVGDRLPPFRFSHPCAFPYSYRQDADASSAAVRTHPTPTTNGGNRYGSTRGKR
jgi:hypothetical protein